MKRTVIAFAIVSLTIGGVYITQASGQGWNHGPLVAPTPTPTATPTSTPTPGPIYFPFIAKRWPPIPYTPFLYPISNPDGDGYYTVEWSEADLAQTYTLQEDDNTYFTHPTTRYTGSNTSDSVWFRPAGTWYYRVRACNSYGCSSWSQTQSVVVIPPEPECELYVDNRTGGRLCYQVHDTGIGQECYSSWGRHYYGTFPAGTYSWHASAWCGSLSGRKEFPDGEWVHRFWCGTGLQSDQW